MGLPKGIVMSTTISISLSFQRDLWTLLFLAIHSWRVWLQLSYCQRQWCIYSVVPNSWRFYGPGLSPSSNLALILCSGWCQLFRERRYSTMEEMWSCQASILLQTKETLEPGGEAMQAFLLKGNRSLPTLPRSGISSWNPFLGQFLLHHR